MFRQPLEGVLGIIWPLVTEQLTGALKIRQKIGSSD